MALLHVVGVSLPMCYSRAGLARFVYYLGWVVLARSLTQLHCPQPILAWQTYLASPTTLEQPR